MADDTDRRGETGKEEDKMNTYQFIYYTEFWLSTLSAQRNHPTSEIRNWFYAYALS